MDGLKPCQFRQVDPQGRILCNVIKGGDREVSVNLCRACPVAQINCQHLRAGLEKKVSTPITVRFATGRVEVWDDSPPTIDFKQAACAAKTMPIQSPRDCAGCPIRLPNVIPQNAIQVAHRARQSSPSDAPASAVAQTPAAPSAQKSGSRASQPAVSNAAPADAHAAAQPITAFSLPRTGQSALQSTPVDVGAANDLISRARATAARKAQEKQQREKERTALETQAQYNAVLEAKPKIIQLQEWLAGQINKKQTGASSKNAYKPQPLNPDADGVSDIVYSPLGQVATAYQETIDYERCVGWTD